MRDKSVKRHRSHRNGVGSGVTRLRPASTSNEQDLQQSDECPIRSSNLTWSAPAKIIIWESVRDALH